MKPTPSGWCFVVIGILACIAFLSGCKKDKSGNLSLEHKALIQEFEIYRVKQCACRDFDCSRKLGQTIGPRVQQVMRDSEKLPREVQVRLGSLFSQMTKCAKSTQEP